MVKCGICDKTTNNAERRTCSQCLKAYHIKCLPGSGSPKDSKTSTDTWKCPKCRAGATGSQVQQPPAKDLTTQINDLKSHFNSKLDTIKSELLKEITNKITAVENSAKTQHDALLEKINALETCLTQAKTSQKLQTKTIEDLQLKVSNMELEITSLKSKVSDCDSVKQTLNDVEQRARLNNLEIFGVPERKTEDLFTIMLSVGQAVGVPMAKEDLEFVTRVPPRVKSPGLPKTIIAKFKSSQLKDTLLSAARKNRHLTSNDIGVPGESKHIYVNEHLTSVNKALLKAARTKCKELGFSHIWTRNAKIYVRMHEKSNAFRIFNMDQVNKLRVQTPS
ncbi:hypothetical protein NE865_09854 [Phthorimaea operculella]|nr:hypothetical protein NE865_09854 [Phthorimaea operculella]